MIKLSNFREVTHMEETPERRSSVIRVDPRSVSEKAVTLSSRRGTIETAAD